MGTTCNFGFAGTHGCTRLTSRFIDGANQKKVPDKLLWYYRKMFKKTLYMLLILVLVCASARRSFMYPG